MSRQKSASVSLLKKRFLTWYENHPDVSSGVHLYQHVGYLGREDIQDISPLWFVVNCVGDMIGWQESPAEWIEQFEDEKRVSEGKS